MRISCGRLNEKWIIDEDSYDLKWTRVSGDQGTQMGGKGNDEKIARRESESSESLRTDRALEDSLTEGDSQTPIATVPMEDGNNRTSSSETNLTSATTVSIEF